MAAEVIADSRHIFYRLSDFTDDRCFSGRQPGMDWCNNIGSLVCLFQCRGISGGKAFLQGETIGQFNLLMEI